MSFSNSKSKENSNSTSTSSLDDHHLNLFHQHRREAQQACQLIISKEATENLQGDCPTVWDNLMCWKRVPADTNSTQPCPDYVPNLHREGSASKYCTGEGLWFFHSGYNTTWTDYSKCVSNLSNISTNYIPPQLHPHLNQTPADQTYLEWVPVIKKISLVGYGVSFVTLLIAFFILVSIKKLRCPRNTLHMHLFGSFMLRAFMALLKDFLFREGLGLPTSVLQGDKGLIFRHNQPNWECKLVTSLWQYFIVANYTWILMEGLYLHNLIFMAPFSDSSSITLYILLGWGCPLLVVGSWVIARYSVEDTFCWTTNLNKNLFLIVRIPIIISIVLNFIFFLNIVRVLLLKLQSAVSIETRKYRYRKWAKSTLVLMPLFGVHYMLFLWMSTYEGQDPVIEVTWLFCDQLFASFQGFFVSILYCLINGEVRSELAKKWNNWRSDTDSKNVWVPLNQISSKFYHRSTHDDLLAHNNGSGVHPTNNSTSCCGNPCSRGSKGSSGKHCKNHHHYHPAAGGGAGNGDLTGERGGLGRYRGGSCTTDGGLSPNSNYTLTQTEEHHLTLNTELPDSPSVSSQIHQQHEDVM